MARKIAAVLLIAATAATGALLAAHQVPTSLPGFGSVGALLEKSGVLNFAQAASPQTEKVPPPPEVPVAEVVVRTFAPSSEFTGHIAAVESVEVRPRVGGYVTAVSVPEGGLVERGQLLFQIDPRPFQATLDHAKAQFAQTEARLALAEADFSRAERLAAKGVSSRETHENAAANRRQRLAEVQAAAAAVAAAELDIAYARVTAPISGRVDRVLVTQGNLVAGSAGGQATVLTTIVSVGPSYAYFDIDEPTFLELVGRVRAGQGGRAAPNLPVQVGLGNDQEFPYEGVLDFLATQVDRNTGTIRARAIVPDPGGVLTPGLFARVRLKTEEERATVFVDDQSVGTDQGKRYVLVLAAGNTAEYRPVELGPVAEGLRSVTKGLRPGESIIVKGLVRPGMQVTPRRVAMGEDRTAATKSRTFAATTEKMVAILEEGRP